MGISLIFWLAFLFRLILSFGPYHPDLGNHLDWGVKFWQLGPKYFYENLFWQVSWPNQPPGTIYLFAIIRKIYEGIFNVSWWLNLKIPAFPSILIPFLESRLYVSLIKLPAILADLGMAFLIYKFISQLKNIKLGKTAALIFLFNPVIWYNSAVWGQTDAIINFFGLWSVYLFWKNRPLWGIFVFILSFYFKGSLLIFFPLILILLFKTKELWWKKVLVLFLTPILLAYLSFPFVRWMSPIPWLYHLYRDRVFGHQGNMLTANAFNLWAFLFGIDLTRTDKGFFLGLTYKNLGMVLFILSAGISLLFIIRKKNKIASVFWAVALVSFSAFCFLTNMHERYVYPVFPYLTVIVFLFPRVWFLYLLLSSISFLNLYHLWYVPYLFWLKSFYTPFFIKMVSFLNISMLTALFWSFLTLRERKKV